MANTPNTPRTDYQSQGEQAGATAGRKVGEALDKGRDAVTSAAGEAGEKVEGVMKSVKDAASSVATTAEDAYEATTEKIGEFNDDVMHLINRHPKQAVLIGFGVGCLIGAVLLGGFFASSRRS